MENSVAYDKDLNMKDTELRLGLPGTEKIEKEETILSAKVSNKRPLIESSKDSGSKTSDEAPPSK
jgi:auxin-responsive protein IAA